MKVKTSKILCILFSVLFLFVSCGQIVEDRYGQSVTINLPHLVNGSSRSISGSDINRLRNDTRKYRVIFQTSSESVVREGTGGAFSASFAVGTEISVTVECLNGSGEVIVRTVAKTLKVGAGDNILSFNLSQDGTEVIPPTPESSSFTVTYNGGGSNVSGLPNDNNPYSANDMVTLATGEPTRPGYTFAGWTTNVAFTGNERNGSIQITPGTTFASSSSMAGSENIVSFQMPESNVELTANWNVITYTIKYVSIGGNTNEDQTFTIEGDATVVLQGDDLFNSSEGTYSKWQNTNNEFDTGSSVSKIELIELAEQDIYVSSKYTITLTAKQESQNTYSITYSWGTGVTGVTGTLPSTQNGITSGTSATVTIPTDVSRLGYEFLGWALSEGNSSANYTYSSSYISSVTQNYTLYAVWREIDTLYVGGNNANDSNNGSDSSPFATLNKAFEIANGLARNDITIHVKESLTQNQTVNLSTKTYTLKADSNAITVSIYNLSVSTGKTLNLENITLQSEGGISCIVSVEGGNVSLNGAKIIHRGGVDSSGNIVSSQETNTGNATNSAVQYTSGTLSMQGDSRITKVNMTATELSVNLPSAITASEKTILFVNDMAFDYLDTAIINGNGVAGGNESVEHDKFTLGHTNSLSVYIYANGYVK